MYRLRSILHCTSFFPASYWCLSHKNHESYPQPRQSHSFHQNLHRNDRPLSVCGFHNVSNRQPRRFPHCIRNRKKPTARFFLYTVSQELCIPSNCQVPPHRNSRQKPWFVLAQSFSQINISKSSESHTHWWYHPQLPVP